MAEAQQDAAMRSFVESAMPGLEQLAAQLGVKKTHTPEELKVITEAAILYAKRDGGDSSQGGEVGGAAPDASSGGKKKTRRGGKKKKKTGAEPAAKVIEGLDFSNSEDRNPSAPEVLRVNGDLLALREDMHAAVVDKLNAVCPHDLAEIDFGGQVDFEARPARSADFHLILIRSFVRQIREDWSSRSPTHESIRLTLLLYLSSPQANSLCILDLSC